MSKAFLATALFAVAALLLAVTQGDPGGRVFVRLLIEVPLLILLAAITALAITAIVAFAASRIGSPRAGAVVAAVLGWLMAGGGHQSFGGLGAYSDLIQPAFAVALAVPWLTAFARPRAEDGP